MKHLAVFLGAAACLTPASAFAQRPMTTQDLLGAVRIADPQLSPDGKWVAFVRTTTNVTSGARNADIWVVAADGSKFLVNVPIDDQKANVVTVSINPFE